MIRKSIVALVAVALLPLSLQAQRPEEATRRIEAALDRAAAAGIPRSLLEERITEGRAKGVSEERIAAVVERRAQALARAREALSRAERNPRAATLSAGADAVEAGVDGSALRAVVEAARAEDRPVAIAVLTYLSSDEVGLPVDRARDQVIEALKKGPDALRELPAQAIAARERRGPPAGVGGRPEGVGRDAAGGARRGPPAGLPTPGQRPGAAGPGNKPGGVPGGKPGTRPGGRP